MENKENIQDEILEWWLILDENTISENDFILWGNSDLSVRLEDITPDVVKLFYNQGAQKRTRNGCTNYASFWCISDLNWHDFILEEILEIHNLAEEKYWWKEASWNYLYKAVDCLRNYRNEKNPNDKVISFRVDLLSEEAQKLIAGGKTIMIWYKTTIKHYKDSQDNWVLDSDTFKWETINWGHAIRHNSWNNIDNYIGVKKYNTYENKKLVDYVKEGTYFRYWYVFFKQEEGIFKDVPKNHPFYESIKWAKENGIVNGYEDGTYRPNQPITRWELAVIIKRAFKNMK